MSWITDLLEATSDLESPRSYYYWSALASISATVGKRVYLDRGGVYRLYPNIYVFLLSKKSGLKKGPPVNLAKKLTYELGTIRTIDGQNSIQGVIKELSQLHTTKKGRVINEAEGFLISGEFASFLLADGIGFSLTTLTDLYDGMYHEQGFHKTLASQEQMTLKAPCLSALFASNETHFFNTVPKHAISGGFLARTFCVYEEKRNVANSLTEKRTKRIDYESITEYLSSLVGLQGEFVMTDEARKAYDDWYYPFVEREETDIDANDESATSERIGDSILKVAMLLSLSKSPDLLISESVMSEAIEKGLASLSSVRKLLFGGNGANEKNIKHLTYRTVLAMMIGAQGHEVSRRKILLKGGGLFGPYDLDETIESLLQAKMITTEKRGGDNYYKLKEWAVDIALGRNKKEN